MSKQTSSTTNYTLQFFVSTRFGDPITSISLRGNSFIMGTMMGKATFHYLSDDNKTWKTFIIIKDDTTLECVSDTSFINDGLFLVAQGDEAIMRFNYDTSKPAVKPDGKRISNYIKESEHKIACDSSYVMLSENYMLKLRLKPPYESGNIIQTTKVEYIIKDFIGENAVPEQPQPQYIEMTNYAVPLDFNEQHFVWVEYCDENKRNFCIADVFNNDSNNVYRYSLDKEFGHISHCRLLNKDIVFIVRNLNVCEIRKVNDEFSIIESFIHIGDEVYAVDVFTKPTNNNTETNEDVALCSREVNTNTNTNNINNNAQRNEVMLNMHEGTDDKNHMIQQTNIMPSEKVYDVEFSKSNRNSSSQSENNYQYININSNIGRNNKANRNELVSSTINNNTNPNELEHVHIEVKKPTTIAETYVGECENESENINEFVITLLDIEGNINVYENGKLRKEFNLYDIKKIDKDHKDKQFFSMGYSYYIKYNGKYFLISSDHGCYVIKKEKAKA